MAIHGISWQGFNWRMGIFANGKVVGNHRLDHPCKTWLFGVPGSFVFDHHFPSHHGMFTSPTWKSPFRGMMFLWEDFRMDFHKTKKSAKPWQLKLYVGIPLLKQLHPRNFTWNLKMMVSKRNFLFQGLLFRFHVKFQGCNNNPHHRDEPASWVCGAGHSIYPPEN